MASDPQILLVLLGLRLQGANASAKLDVFKALKKHVADAVSQGLIESSEVVVVKNGKPQKKKETVFNLTLAGTSYLETHAGTEAHAAANAAQARELQQALKVDRETLCAEIRGSIAKKPKGGDPAKEIAVLTSRLEAMAQALAKLEASLKQDDGGEILARIDAAFAALEKKLQSRLGTPGPGDSTAAQTPSSSTKPLRSTLRDAYETLCLYIEFDSGVVEIPRLYHEVRKAVPSLTVHAFQQELESLWSQHVLELKVINEVRSAKEPDKAIRRGDNLYYFVFWPNK